MLLPDKYLSSTYNVLGTVLENTEMKKKFLLSWSLNSMRRVRQQNILKENMSDKCYREK